MCVCRYACVCVCCVRPCACVAYGSTVVCGYACRSPLCVNSLLYWTNQLVSVVSAYLLITICSGYWDIYISRTMVVCGWVRGTHGERESEIYFLSWRYRYMQIRYHRNRIRHHTHSGSRFFSSLSSKVFCTGPWQKDMTHQMINYKISFLMSI